MRAGESRFVLGAAKTDPARLEGVTEDPIADTEGLEYATQLGGSADGKLVFAAEFASDSIAVFNVELGPDNARCALAWMV
eukprot:2573165-Rhodomonas_salina.3